MRIEALTIVAIIAVSVRARAACSGDLDTQIVPLPVWATDPNEGSTWGAMPVFIRVCRDTKKTQWILAPSVTWNSIIELTGTFRYYDYRADDTTLAVIASASKHINERLVVLWDRLPASDGDWTDELALRIERSVFLRFYGFGPDTPSSAESSYTGVQLLATYRRGVNLPLHLNIGLFVGFERDDVEDRGVNDLPLAPEVFPDAPGMGGATVLSQGVELRYDDRVGRELAESGLRVEASAAVVEGLDRSPDFLRFRAGARALWHEFSRLSGAARASWTAVTADGVPFQLQSELGGAFVLRGFNLGRFIDKQAWTIETEQRITVFQTHIFGVVADWRVDPFVAAGQVFSDWDRAFDQTQLAFGVGLRAFVHPNVLGRIDLASGGEGLKVYVEIGYPY